MPVNLLGRCATKTGADILAAKRIYLDSSVLVALFTPDPFRDRANAFIRAEAPILFTAGFALVEFSSAISRLFRMKLFTSADTQAVFTNFDDWSAREVHLVALDPSDLVSANASVRQLKLGLRAPDAIHLAIAQRLGLELATFDEQMTSAAKALRITTARL